MVAWAVGAKGLEDAVWVDSSDIGFQADEQRLAEDLADAVAEAMEEWIEGLGDGDEVTADDFKRQCEDAISLA